MELRDVLQRFLFEHTAVRGELVQLDTSWREVLGRHDYPPGVRRLLGEMMAAAALLSATLKFSGSMTMQIQGGGPVSLLVVECGADLGMRAVAKWEGVVEDGAGLPELVGNGHFVITLDPGEGKKTYQGIVEVTGDTVAEALEHYMAHSEQLETRLFLAADEWGAAGMLLQKLPGGRDGDQDAWNRAVQLGPHADCGGIAGLDPARHPAAPLPRRRCAPVRSRAGELPMFLFARAGRRGVAHVGAGRSHCGAGGTWPG